MLKQTLLTIGSLIVFLCVAVQPATAQVDDMEFRRLEAQISDLKDQVRELRVVNAEMKKLLEAIAVAVLQDNAEAVINRSSIQNCQIRLNDLEKKRDELRTLGFSDKYPDIVNITNRIAELQSECMSGSEPNQQ